MNRLDAAVGAGLDVAAEGGSALAPWFDPIGRSTPKIQAGFRTAIWMWLAPGKISLSLTLNLVVEWPESAGPPSVADGSGAASWRRD